MTDRNDGIKRWMGFKADSDPSSKEPQAASDAANGGGALARIRELESQLSELRSRRDITSLSKEEFEILATETAMTLIRTAQQREVKATQTAERLLSESKRAAQSAIESAEGKAKSVLSQAESRGRRLIEAAEGDVKELIHAAESRAEELVNTKRREGIAIVSTARKEAEQMVTSAMSEVTSYRTWLTGVVSEAERLYKVQTQSLDAASSAIEQSRSRLDAAWERLSQLSKAVERTIDENGRPRISRKETSAESVDAVSSDAQSRSMTSRSSSPSKTKSKSSRSKKK